MHASADQLLGPAATFVDTQQAGKGQLAPVRVLARPLSQRLLVAADVQQIVDDLKGQAQPLAVFFQRRTLPVASRAAISAPSRSETRNIAPVLRR